MDNMVPLLEILPQNDRRNKIPDCLIQDMLEVHLTINIYPPMNIYVHKWIMMKRRAETQNVRYQ